MRDLLRRRLGSVSLALAAYNAMSGAGDLSAGGLAARLVPARRRSFNCASTCCGPYFPIRTSFLLTNSSAP